MNSLFHISPTSPDSMKARAKRNDFEGTTAADMPGGFKPSEFFKQKGIDTEKYDPVGTKFYPLYKGGLRVSVLCLDAEKSTKERPFIVEIQLKEPMPYREYFGLFRKFEAIMIEAHYQQFAVSQIIETDESEGWR